MKTQKLPNWSIAAMILAVSLSACGKTNRGESEMAPATTSSSITTPSPVIPPPTNTSTSTSTSTNTVTLEDPLSFEFVLNGNQNAITPSFQTDNVLKVKFAPGNTQGNSFHSASELAVTLTVNGTDFVPKYTANNYTYGKIGETSNVIDLSGYITPGGNIQIAVKSPKSDFYCTYAPTPFYYWDGTQWAPVNAHYNVYPGCRKAVYSTHQWSGRVIVQTSHTSGI